jgi:hypothetical protein
MTRQSQDNTIQSQGKTRIDKIGQNNDKEDKNKNYDEEKTKGKSVASLHKIQPD